jgi:hypothetical protein
LKAVHDLSNIEEHVKNFRPQILCMSGFPGVRPPLVDFANLICKHRSLLVCGNIIEVSPFFYENLIFFRRIQFSVLLGDVLIKLFTYTTAWNVIFGKSGTQYRMTLLVEGLWLLGACEGNLRIT